MAAGLGLPGLTGHFAYERDVVGVHRFKAGLPQTKCDLATMVGAVAPQVSQNVSHGRLVGEAMLVRILHLALQAFGSAPVNERRHLGFKLAEPDLALMERCGRPNLLGGGILTLESQQPHAETSENVGEEPAGFFRGRLQVPQMSEQSSVGPTLVCKQPLGT